MVFKYAAEYFGTALSARESEELGGTEARFEIFHQALGLSIVFNSFNKVFFLIDV